MRCINLRLTYLLTYLLQSSRSLSRRPRDSESGFMQRDCPSVRPSVCLSVCRQNTKMRFAQKLRNELWCLLTTYSKSYVGFSKNPLLDLDP